MFRRFCQRLIALMLAINTGASPTSLFRRQTWTGVWAHDLTDLGCRNIVFIFARETIGPGNMVSSIDMWSCSQLPSLHEYLDGLMIFKGDKVGPQLSNGLKTVFGPSNVATEGVDYLALPDTNFLQGGAPPVGIGEMQLLLTTAAVTCPNSIIVAAGYSQGAAITHRAIEGLPQGVKDRIAGVVTFGDTQTLQHKGHIAGYPIDKTLIICNVGDVICTGTLWVFPIHLDYTKRVPEAVTFLVSRILEAAAIPL